MADLPADLVAYIDEVKDDSIHAYRFLEETGTLSASRTFGVAHRARDDDALINVRFPQPWAKNREPKVTGLLIEEAARFQAIAEQIGGAQDYTPGALDLQWKRTGLLEKARAYSG